MDAIVKTDFCFPGQKSVYKGKVRDVYDINDEYLVMVVSDRISAFDVILPEGVPYKGYVLRIYKPARNFRSGNPGSPFLL